ncbi:MAG: DUF4340 domain-containing protein [Candidatus Delongbacteria bacterium]|nr:DUF4340 domain-containing protein [Candidatus Delongbacteria bacterium]
MAKKNNFMKTYIIIFLVLAAFLIFVSLRNKKFEQTSEPVFKVNQVNLTSFTLSKGDDSVTLLKDDSLWVFQEPDTGMVDQNKIKTLLENTLKIQRTGFITDKPEKYSQFNVDSNAVKFELFVSGQKVEELLIGRSKSSWSTNYIKYPVDPKIYISQESILNRVQEKADFWRKR